MNKNHFRAGLAMLSMTIAVPAAATSSQGTLGATSTGSVTINVSVPSRVQITGLSDVNFTGVDPALNATNAQSNCVWSNTATVKVMGMAALLGAAVAAAPVSADLVFNQAVVDLAPDKPPRFDIDASNTGTERIYVVAEPAEIVDPGTPGERRVGNPDPQALGLLVTPQKMILDPGEHKLVRIASIVPRSAVERIYRVTIKPVVGEVTAPATALKILVGYDVLVIVRPTAMRGLVTGARRGDTLVLTNNGSTNVEIYQGRQCDPQGTNCKPLAARRLYAGTSFVQSIDPARPVDYRIKTGETVEQQRF